MKNKILISYLTYINSANRDRRYGIFEKTFDSFSKLKDDKSIVLMSIDNNSDKDIRQKLKNANIFDYTLHLDDNFIDISLLYYTAKLADQLNIEYMFYSYDDFLFYDHDFAKDCISFMQDNREVHSMRMPIYDIEKPDQFDSFKTDKMINPDAIRHYNQPARKMNHNSKLIFEGPLPVGHREFYITNWHYTSRPTLWRTSFFKKVFDDIGDKIPVMQNFEGSSRPIL